MKEELAFTEGKWVKSANAAIPDMERADSNLNCISMVADRLGVAMDRQGKHLSRAELETPAAGSGSLTMKLNMVCAVKTVDRVVAEVGKTVDRLHDLAIGMEPEDGIIWVYGTA